VLLLLLQHQPDAHRAAWQSPPPSALFVQAQHAMQEVANCVSCTAAASTTADSMMEQCMYLLNAVPWILCVSAGTVEQNRMLMGFADVARGLAFVKTRKFNPRF